ncbi:MAG: CreA family protein [Methylobacter sp.]|uniref:CreA family protein n=1 Tax=Candidatus Methylobacter titanis TaxID=3053457 RepID=A0AA43TL62_9GAMM|nr:CreA family protein [Candidatus Methylobacter titanis]
MTFTTVSGNFSLTSLKRELSYEQIHTRNDYLPHSAAKAASLIQLDKFMKKQILLVLTMVLNTLAFTVSAEEIGDVTTTFKLLGANHKIVIEAFDDPDVPGVTCHMSHAKTGGIKGSVGLAEDPSEASIACRQIGVIDASKLDKLKNGDVVFKEGLSLIFKSLQVVRFYDKKRNVLVYLAYSDKVIEGSPKNSISSVPVMKWN